MGTRFQELRWKTRHILKKDWAQSYIKSTAHPHRSILIEKISEHTPFKTALEIGCNTGPNLYLLTKRFPNIQCYGIDINSDAIRKEKKWLGEQNISNIDLSVGRADKLNRLKSNSIDIVFTDATCLYIGPDKIQRVLKEMIRIGKKTVILLEFHSDSNETHRYYDAHWIYNYRLIMRSIKPSASLSITKIGPAWWNDEAWRQFGAIVEISL